MARSRVRCKIRAARSSAGVPGSDGPTPLTRRGGPDVCFPAPDAWRVRLRLPQRPEVRLPRGLLQRVTAPAPGAVVQALVDNHQRFLAFLERRVGSRDTAEDILQDGFVRALERADTLRAGESASAWFYRLLRNALVDPYRRRSAENRALAAAAAESQALDTEAELRDTVCACIRELIATLKVEIQHRPAPGRTGWGEGGCLRPRSRHHSNERLGPAASSTGGAAAPGARELWNVRNSRLPRLRMRRAPRA